MTTALPRLQQSIAIVSEDRTPSLSFHIWWDQFAEALEGNLADLATQQAALAATQAALTAAQADIITAQADIVAAQAALAAQNTQILAQQTQILEALSHMADITDIHVAADSSGVPLPTELPRSVQSYRYSDDATDVTSSATWSFTTDTGALTATITNGLLVITALMADTVVTVSSLYNGITKSRSFLVLLDQAPADITTSDTATTSTIGPTTAATMTTVAGPLSVTVGAGGAVTLTAGNIKTRAAGGSPTGAYRVYGIWQISIAGVWTDIGTETADSYSCQVFPNGTSVSGSLGVNTSVSGLTPATVASFRFQARNNIGTTNVGLSGNLTVKSS